MSAENFSPISGATVTCNGKTLGYTNSEGVIDFRTKCKKVDVSAKGYYEADVVVDKIMEISLVKADPKVQSIEAVIINDKSDPEALKILTKVNERFKENAPQSLDSYTFRSYEKISLDFDQDSIQNYKAALDRRLDSLAQLPKKTQTEKKKKDSLEELKILKLFGESKPFLWERASEFLYSKKYGEKINILDNRVAGLQQPVYEMLALRSNRNREPREVRAENRSLYRYFLTDSIEIDGRKNYVIRFRQVDNKSAVNRRRYNGYIYIDAETYGLKKIESNSNKRTEGSITSIWTPIDNKWFLLKENLKIRMGQVSFANQKDKDDDAEKSVEKKRQRFGNYVYMTADYFDFVTPIEVKKKDFSGYSMSVKNSDGTLIQQYRTDSLSAREKLTYEKIDSVGKKYRLDQKLNIFGALLRGKIRAGIVDIDAGEIFKYNKYESVRLGFAAKLNEKFNAYFSPDAYFAYGFKDHTWKYGVGLDWHTTLERTSFFRAEYYNDVVAAGRFNEGLWNFKMKFMNSGIDLNNDRFYHFQGAKISYETDLSNALTLKISAKKDEEEAKFSYDYMNLGNAFKNFSTQLTLKYAPNSKNIMTPAGKYSYEQNYPEFYLNYEQALKTLGGDFDYSRIDFLMQHRFRTDAGVTGLRLYAGWLSGKAPIWHHFAMNGLSNDHNKLNFNLTSFLGFATMQGGKYYADQFVGYYFTHRIPWYFRTFGKTTSSIDLVYKGIVGDMKNPEYHQFEFEVLNHFYQEIGLEANNFLGTPFNLGFFYRVGHYATGNFKDNFGIQLKLKFLGF